VNINKKVAVRFESPPKRCRFCDAIVNFSIEKMHKGKIDNGKIVKRWNVTDRLEIARQLGIL
jgi:predicted ester cyclase